MREGLILTLLGLGGLGLAGFFVKRAIAAPEVPLPPEEEPPVPPFPPAPVAEVRNLEVAYALEVE